MFDIEQARSNVYRIVIKWCAWCVGVAGLVWSYLDQTSWNHGLGFLLAYSGFAVGLFADGHSVPRSPWFDPTTPQYKRLARWVRRIKWLCLALILIAVAVGRGLIPVVESIGIIALVAVGISLLVVYLIADISYVVDRWRPRVKWGMCPNCTYDLTGAIEAKREDCPECGEAIPSWMFVITPRDVVRKR